MKYRVAIAQAEPRYLDLASGLDYTETLVAQAAKQGAQLVAFPETWLPGYPAWLDCARDVGLWDHSPVKRLYAKLARESIEVPGADCNRLAEMARSNQVVLSVGVQERGRGKSGNATLYNSILMFDTDGRLIQHHRKIMPTFTERLIWGHGDGSGLHGADTSGGVRIGGLICWEHWMPMARQKLHTSGEQIHIAQWPWVKEMALVASRHYAFEGRCFVLACGALLHAGALPSELELLPELLSSPDPLLLRGGSAIIGPDGTILAGPLMDVTDILHAEVDLDRIWEESLTMDVAGHYSRPDLFGTYIG